MGRLLATRKPTSAAPIEIAGVTFRCYREGIGQYKWHTDDARATVWSNYSMASYSAAVDGASIGKRFRRKRTAMAAAVKAMKRSKQ